MIVSFSKEFRYRNLGGQSPQGRPEPVNLLIIALVTSISIVCFAALGVIIGLALSGKPLSNPFASGKVAPTVTRTSSAKAAPSPKAEVPLNTPGVNENGLQLTVISFVHPLQVQGPASVPPNEEFALVTVTVQNTQTSGQALTVKPSDFKVKGDGARVYDANPRNLMIDKLLTGQDQLAPGKKVEREMIFQIAKDDSGLKLYWTVGKTTRIFVLQPE